MMPPAMLPAMPSASTVCRRSSPIAFAAASAAPIVPSTLVGWKPALWIALGMIIDSRHVASTPATMPSERRAAVAPETLARGEHRRERHRARMDRPAFEGVVEVLAVRGRAVDERRSAGVDRSRIGRSPCMAATGVRSGDERLHVIGVARCYAEPDDVYQQLLGALAHRGRNCSGRSATAFSARISATDCVDGGAFIQHW